ncbi:hypothetical protein Q5P01_004714 [Channa striata]|uniref:Uncharacterized protein n=1 Tax=Channa striata TaxID=64152 RepID=A0AA88NCC2_CHASR|nr:hypothetical protein Q5P01_004714 [Channa striata]
MTTGLHAPRRSSGPSRNLGADLNSRLWAVLCGAFPCLVRRQMDWLLSGDQCASGAALPAPGKLFLTPFARWPSHSSLLLPVFPPPLPASPLYLFRFLIPGVRHPAFTGLVMQRFHVEPRGKTIGNGFFPYSILIKAVINVNKKPPLAPSSTTAQRLRSAGQDHPEGACSGELQHEEKGSKREREGREGGGSRG